MPCLLQEMAGRWYHWSVSLVFTIDVVPVIRASKFQVNVGEINHIGSIGALTFVLRPVWPDFVIFVQELFIYTNKKMPRCIKSKSRFKIWSHWSLHKVCYSSWKCIFLFLYNLNVALLDISAKRLNCQQWTASSNPWQLANWYGYMTVPLWGSSGQSYKERYDCNSRL